MDDETAKRIEYKIDLIAKGLICLTTIGASAAVYYLNTWGSWSPWVSGAVLLILPFCLFRAYKENPPE